MRARIAALLITISLILLTLLPIQAETSNQSVGFTGRWILIDLSHYRAIAYEGTNAVYSAPVTSGKPGWETPTGIFFIQSRVLAETMSSETMGIPRWDSEGYHLDNVMYTQYFLGNGYAIHGNYWSPDWVFGEANVSHGCVSMRNDDAAYFWFFADYGTPVVVSHVAGGIVPPVVGLNVKDASATLAAAGYRTEVHYVATTAYAVGTVLAQKPVVGTALASGETVIVAIVAGSSPATITSPETTATTTHAEVRKAENGAAWVPDVVGLPEEQARALIEQAGLTNTYANYQTATDLPPDMLGFFNSIQAGAVLSTDPPYGQQVSEFTTVRLAVRVR